MPHSFLTDIVLLLAVSIPIVVLLRRVQLPTVAGFVVAGALVGPHALSWVRSVEEVESLAEIGVALLLFTVGLEFSLPRLLLLKRALLVGGVGQVLLTIAVVAGGGVLLGRDVAGATLFAFLVVLSSTAVVLKTLTDERQVDTPHGQLAVAILLFQDLAIIPLLLFVPLLSGADGGGLADFGVAGLKALGAVAVVLLAARYGFSRMAPVVVRSTSTMASTSTMETELGVMSPCRSKLTTYKRPVSSESCMVAGKSPSSHSPTSWLVPVSYL